MARSVLITGGSGFIGRNLAEQFSKRYLVSAPSHKELDLADEAAVAVFLKRKKFDFVIHCATKPGHRFAKDITGLLDVNTKMFKNMVGNSGSFGKIIHIGSGSAYGSEYYVPKMKEEYFGVHVPSNESDLSKYVISKSIDSMDNALDLRVFGIFGKYEEYAIRFISNAICKAIFGLPITIRQNRLMDYIYINDLVPVIEYFMENNSVHRAYNVSPDSSIGLYVLAEKVRDISQRDVPIIVSKEGMGVEYSGDNSRLKKEIRGLRFTPIDDAIRELYEWYEENKGILNRDLLLVDR